MSRQPIIIQVLSTGDHRTIRRWMMAIGIITASFLTLAIMLALEYAQNSQNILITGVMVLVLFGNVLLFFRNKMIDHRSESLCFDGEHCYSVKKSGVTHDQLPVRLSYKREMLIIQSDLKKEWQPETIAAFQVLNHQDWKAIKQLSTHWGSVPEAV
jgi:hypothetical protein